MKKYEQVYLDWDGVIWDFKAAFCDWHGLDIPDSTEWDFYRQLGMNDQQFHSALRKLPKEFWSNADYITSDAKSLVKWARDNAEKVTVLTVTGGDNACLSGKRDIAAKTFGLNVQGVRSADDKLNFAKSLLTLLVDDKQSTVVEWTQKGGAGYVWPAAYNQNLHSSWHFNKDKLVDLGAIKKKAHWALTDEDRSALLKEMAAEKAEKAEKDEKAVLDYDSMEEAKRRKMTPMFSGCLAYFPDALAQVAQNSMVGHYQHNDPKDEMYWDRSKSSDELDAIIRHLADHSKDPYDADGRLHLSKVAWRALAMLQKFIEENNNEQG